MEERDCLNRPIAATGEVIGRTCDYLLEELSCEDKREQSMLHLNMVPMVPLTVAEQVGLESIASGSTDGYKYANDYKLVVITIS